MYYESDRLMPQEGAAQNYRKRVLATLSTYGPPGNYCLGSGLTAPVRPPVFEIGGQLKGLHVMRGVAEPSRDTWTIAQGFGLKICIHPLKSSMNIIFSLFGLSVQTLMVRITVWSVAFERPGF